jgi:hypothetical protein
MSQVLLNSDNGISYDALVNKLHFRVMSDIGSYQPMIIQLDN